MKFILASKSQRRIEILKRNNYLFKITPAKIEEKSYYQLPHMIVKQLSYAKALSVAIKNPNMPVLAADTIVYCKGRIIGKPKNKKEAFKMLKFQSGKWQSVYTGVSLIWIKKNIYLCDWEKSRCYMKKIDNQKLTEISSKHLDKAGGWAVQDGNDLLIKKIKGRYDNIVGLPMNIVRKFFKKADIKK
ncbi:MAG: Maf family protein [Elusimicrobiota bacterium]